MMDYFYSLEYCIDLSTLSVFPRVTLPMLDAIANEDNQ